MKLRAFALPLLLLYPLYGGVMFAKQQDILFPAASKDRHPLQATLPDNGRLIELDASFGRVRAVYLQPKPAASRGVAMIYLHGNFERIEDSFALLQPLTQAGIGILQLEYPGFGGADGEPSFADITEAADLGYDWLVQQAGVDAQHLAIMGYSIGGGAAAELSRRRPARALILLSTYTSMQDLAHLYGLPGFLARYPYDTVARVGEFSGSLFIEHGRKDKVIPFRMGKQLARVARRAEFVALDCGHDDCHFDRSLFAGRIPRWLDTIGLSIAPAVESAQSHHAF